MKEKEIQALTLDYLKARGIWAFKVHTQGIRFSGSGKSKNPNAGQFDVRGYFVTGRGLEIEIKKPGLELSTDQAKWKARCDRFNVVAFKASSLEEVAENLSKYPKEFIPPEKSGD